MASNRAFQWGHLPNYCTSSNDTRHLIPEGGYGNFGGSCHESHFHDANSSKTSYKVNANSNNSGNWNSNWYFSYINGQSEVSLNDRTRVDSSQVQNKADNSRANSDNPSNPHEFFNANKPSSCFYFSKPMGEQYKSCATYLGDPINIDKDNKITHVNWQKNQQRINPMGLSFGWEWSHEFDSGAVDAYPYMVMHGMYILLFSRKTEDHKIAELFNAPSWVLELGSNNSSAKVDNLRYQEVPGRFKQIYGEHPPHEWSSPTRNASRSIEVQGTSTGGTTRGDSAGKMAVGSRGHIAYYFSNRTQQAILKGDYIPLGIYIKWGGFLKGGVYSAADNHCKLYDVNYIAHNPKTDLDGYKFERVNKRPIKMWETVDKEQEVINGKKYLEM